MLTIKKRYPFNRLYIYGSAALIIGYAGALSVLSILPQRIDTEVAIHQPAAKTSPIETKKDTSSQNESATTQNAPIVIATRPTQPSQTNTETAATTPTTEEQNPTTPPETPVEQDPEEPVDPPAEEPTDPTNPIGDVLEDVLLP